LIIFAHLPGLLFETETEKDARQKTTLTVVLAFYSALKQLDLGLPQDKGKDGRKHKGKKKDNGKGSRW